jgi:hypothetical protein
VFAGACFGPLPRGHHDFKTVLAPVFYHRAGSLTVGKPPSVPEVIGKGWSVSIQLRLDVGIGPSDAVQLREAVGGVVGFPKFSGCAEYEAGEMNVEPGLQGGVVGLHGNLL